MHYYGHEGEHCLKTLIYCTTQGEKLPHVGPTVSEGRCYVAAHGHNPQILFKEDHEEAKAVDSWGPSCQA